MQVLNFPQPDPNAPQEHVVEVLEAALAMARAGEITSVMVITLDDRGDSDQVGVLGATDGWTQTAGMLMAAQRSI
jgi:hypothetical protein